MGSGFNLSNPFFYAQIFKESISIDLKQVYFHDYSIEGFRFIDWKYRFVCHFRNYNAPLQKN